LGNAFEKKKLPGFYGSEFVEILYYTKTIYHPGIPRLWHTDIQMTRYAATNKSTIQATRHHQAALPGFGMHEADLGFTHIKPESVQHRQQAAWQHRSKLRLGGFMARTVGRARRQAYVASTAPYQTSRLCTISFHHFYLVRRILFLSTN